MALPAVNPKRYDIVVIKDNLFTFWLSFPYDMDDYDILFTLKRDENDTTALLEVDGELYNSANSKKARVDLLPEETKDLDISTSAKAYYTIEARHITDETDRGMWLFGKVTLREKGRSQT